MYYQSTCSTSESSNVISFQYSPVGEANAQAILLVRFKLQKFPTILPFYTSSSWNPGPSTAKKICKQHRISETQDLYILSACYPNSITVTFISSDRLWILSSGAWILDFNPMFVIITRTPMVRRWPFQSLEYLVKRLRWWNTRDKWHVSPSLMYHHSIVS